MKAAWAEALDRGDTTALEGLLAEGADVDACDRYGQTGLMRAAHAGRLDVVELLLRHGAALDVTAKFGLSALMLAVVGGHTEVARRLARAGADCTLHGSGAPGFAGKTARDLALDQGLHQLAEDLNAG
ncbi:MAG: ankyrin repeat domain-containing protein [Myxococcota bacterium]